MDPPSSPFGARSRRWSRAAQHVDKTLVSIPVGLLQASENTIGFASNSFGSGAPPTNTHDDFEFGDVVLLLSK